MGWLDLILGKKTARTIKKVQNSVFETSAQPRTEKKAVVPKVVWQKSEEGNDTAEIDGFLITIYREEDGWTYRYSEILDAEDIADGMIDTPEFGDWFPTKTEAKKASLVDFT